jgi:hypothetical protein
MVVEDLQRVKAENKAMTERATRLENDLTLTNARTVIAKGTNQFLETSMDTMREGIRNMQQVTQSKQISMIELQDKCKNARESAKNTLRHWLQEIERKNDFMTIDKTTLDEAQMRAEEKAGQEKMLRDLQAKKRKKQAIIDDLEDKAETMNAQQAAMANPSTTKVA